MRSEAPMPMAHAAQPAVASPADTADLPPSSEFEVQGKAARSVTSRTLELHNFHPRDPKGDMANCSAFENVRWIASDEWRCGEM